MRLSSLISNILKLNKLENQRITPEAEYYDVSRQLCECILQLEDAWDEKELELEAEIEEKSAAQVEAELRAHELEIQLEEERKKNREKKLSRQNKSRRQKNRHQGKLKYEIVKRSRQP